MWTLAEGGRFRPWPEATWTVGVKQRGPRPGSEVFVLRYWSVALKNQAVPGKHWAVSQITGPVLPG